MGTGAEPASGVDRAVEGPHTCAFHSLRHKCFVRTKRAYSISASSEMYCKAQTLVTTIRRDGLDEAIGCTGRAKALSTPEDRVFAGDGPLTVDPRGGKELFQRGSSLVKVAPELVRGFPCCPALLVTSTDMLARPSSARRISALTAKRNSSGNVELSFRPLLAGPSLLNFAPKLLHCSAPEMHSPSARPTKLQVAIWPRISVICCKQKHHVGVQTKTHRHQKSSYKNTTVALSSQTNG